MILRAPFPWYGGKSRAAEIAWRGFGNTPNYVEPFFGSGAVLLGRPHEPKIETVNDIDASVANFWRAVSADPDAVARHCDWPVNEADMHARHRWLVAHLAELRDKLRADPEFYDVQVAGWWVWGLSMWIGSGWCQLPREGASSRSARGVTHQKRPELSCRNGGNGVHGATAGGTREIPERPRRRRNRGSVAVTSRPDLDGIGRGVNSKMPNVYARGQGNGVHQNTKRPNCGNTGEGVHANELVEAAAQKPALHGEGRGISARLPDLMGSQGIVNGRRGGRWAEGAPVTTDGPPCQEWFRALQARLRRVRVCCGDWSRVLTDSVVGTTRTRNSGMNPCAIFLDPPYSGDIRARDLYAVDDGDVAVKVAEWAREHGDDPDLRIALCGYEGEHEMPASWRKYAWKATRGYAAADNDNRALERIWFSPHCLPIEDAQRSLFAP